MNASKLYAHPTYIKELKYLSMLEIPWEKLQGKSILLSGATGLIGSLLVDALMFMNQKGLDCKVYAMTRNTERARARFVKWVNEPLLCLWKQDMNDEIADCEIERLDYIIHMASNTHPLQYATDPIGTITINILGLNRLLEFAAKNQTGRFLFCSSNEVYGENRGDTELFDENYCGYLDPNTLRAGYPESKRCGEALCQAFIVQKGLDIVIPRFTRSYGPTMLPTDTKAISQFIKKAIEGEDIVLKSEGKQFYSYTYVVDAVSGLLTIMTKGETGEAYNIADESSDITLKDLAALIAEKAGRKVIMEKPDSVEAKGYSKATKARLDGAKIRRLGWRPCCSIQDGIERTLNILQDIW